MGGLLAPPLASARSPRSLSLASAPAPALSPPPAPSGTPVHFAADYPGAWLEGRSRVDAEDWHRLCAAPCDRPVTVDGMDLRVVAPRMTPSNAFVVEAGSGTARLKVNGGSESSRQLGIIGLAGGLVVSAGGMALFGIGSVNDEKALRIGGIGALGLGAVAVAVALPLLFSGGTTVKDAKGRTIASTGAFRF